MRFCQFLSLIFVFFCIKNGLKVEGGNAEIKIEFNVTQCKKRNTKQQITDLLRDNDCGTGILCQPLSLFCRTKRPEGGAVCI